MVGLAELYHPDVPRPKPILRPARDAAAEFGLSVATIWRYLADGRLKRYYTTVGRRRTMIDMAELQELMQNPPTELAPPSREKS